MKFVCKLDDADGADDELMSLDDADGELLSLDDEPMPAEPEPLSAEDKKIVKFYMNKTCIYPTI